MSTSVTTRCLKIVQRLTDRGGQALSAVSLGGHVKGTCTRQKRTDIERRMREFEKWISLGLSIVCMMFLLCSCAEDRTLAFEIIYQSDGSLGGQEPDPDLYVVARPEDLDALRAELQPPPELVEQLTALDYGDYLAIITSRGRMGGTTTDLIPQTRQVIRRGNQVVLKVHFGDIDPDKGVKPAESNAYQVIAVPKEGHWGRRIRFVLEVDGEEVRERTHDVP